MSGPTWLICLFLGVGTERLHDWRELPFRAAVAVLWRGLAPR